MVMADINGDIDALKRASVQLVDIVRGCEQLSGRILEEISILELDRLAVKGDRGCRYI
jgi:hypothetical protein